MEPDAFMKYWPIINTIALLLMGGAGWAMRSGMRRFTDIHGTLTALNATIGALNTNMAVHGSQLEAHKQEDERRFEELRDALSRFEQKFDTLSQRILDRAFSLEQVRKASGGH